MTTLTPADSVGAETLELLRDAHRYNAWQYSRVARYVGARVCEIGAGIGNISSFIVQASRELVVLTDTDPYYRTRLQERFGARADVVIDGVTLPDPAAVERFRAYRLDSVVALNVVEHIPDDVGALRSIAHFLSSGGRAIILVPALKPLYGSLDVELGHCRRYTRRDLATRMHEAGFAVECIFFFNLLGAIGWWANARVMKRTRISSRQLQVFEALVPGLRWEDRFSLPFGQSLIAVGVVR